MNETPISRGFKSKRGQQNRNDRVPPGQHVTPDFPILSAGPTPQIKVVDWTLALQLGGRLLGTWNWDEFEALPQTTVKVDIHCVTTWSKLDTAWRGVTFDDLLKAFAESGLLRPSRLSLSSSSLEFLRQRRVLLRGLTHEFSCENILRQIIERLNLDDGRVSLDSTHLLGQPLEAFLIRGTVGQDVTRILQGQRAVPPQPPPHFDA